MGEKMENKLLCSKEDCNLIIEKVEELKRKQNENGNLDFTFDDVAGVGSIVNASNFDVLQSDNLKEEET